MYLSAHLVRASDGRQGVNSFHYCHKGESLPLTTSGAPDVERVVAAQPGRCIAEHTEIPPGGNTVVAFLDVAARDGTDPKVVRQIVQTALQNATSGSLPFRISESDVAVSIGTTLALEGDDTALGAELQRLADRVIEEYEQSRPEGRRTEPDLIWVRSLPSGWELSIPPASRGDPPASARSIARLLLPAAELQHFPGGERSALMEGAAVLLGRSADASAGERGVRLVDPESGRLLIESPPPLVYRTANAGVNIEIRRRAFDILEKDVRAQRHVIAPILFEPGYLFAATLEQARAALLQGPRSSHAQTRSWSGDTPTHQTRGPRDGSWTQPFKGVDRFRPYWQPLDAFLARLGAEVEVVSQTGDTPIRIQMTGHALRAELQRPPS